MRPFNPHKKSQQLRHFKPTRKPAGIFITSIVFADASLIALAFFLATSPFVVQPGINIQLPPSPFSGGARFGDLVLAITPGGNYYFEDERLDLTALTKSLRRAIGQNPNATLIIEADKRVPHGDIISAWNAAQEAGITTISIATQPPKPPTP